MKFYTQYRPAPDKKEKISTISICEKTGYVPADVLITRMINAGKVFQAQRSQYDCLDGGTLDYNQDIDLRKPGADILDVTMKIKSVREAMKPILRQQSEMEKLAEQANPQPSKPEEKKEELST